MNSSFSSDQFCEHIHPVQLEAYGVLLQPLKSGHEPGLATALDRGGMWKSTSAELPAPDQMHGYVQQQLQRVDQRQAIMFAIMDVKTKDVFGLTCYDHFTPATGHLAVGDTWFSTSPFKLDAIVPFLLLNYAFEVIGAQTVDLYGERTVTQGDWSDLKSSFLQALVA